MKMPENLTAAFDLSDKKKEEANVTVDGKDLMDIDLKEMEEVALGDKEEGKDGLDLQEKMEVEALADKKGLSNMGGTNGANQQRAEINQNYSGSLRKVARDQFAEKNKGFKKK